MGVCTMYSWQHEELLTECGLTIVLETQRLGSDQIEVFKILNGYENTDSNFFLKISTGKITRRHNFTLVKEHSGLDVREYSFSQRTTNVWSKLSTDCVHVSSVNILNERIDRYLVTHTWVSYCSVNLSSWPSSFFTLPWYFFFAFSNALTRALQITSQGWIFLLISIMCTSNF